MQHIELTLTVLRSITVVLGLIFLAYAVRAYRRTHSRNLLVLTVAICLLTTAVVAEGAIYQFLIRVAERETTYALNTAHIAEAILTLIAFIVLVGSVLLGDRRRRRVRPTATPPAMYDEASGERSDDEAPADGPRP